MHLIEEGAENTVNRKSCSSRATELPRTAGSLAGVRAADATRTERESQRSSGA